MSTRNDKLRGLFLAALMVFSVFAGTIAFAGGAAAEGANAQVTLDAGNSSVAPNSSLSEGGQYSFDVTATLTNVTTNSGTVDASANFTFDTLDLSSASVTNAQVYSTGSNTNTTNVGTNYGNNSGGTPFVNVTWDDSGGAANETIVVEFTVNQVNAPSGSLPADVNVTTDVDADGTQSNELTNANVDTLNGGGDLITSDTTPTMTTSAGSTFTAANVTYNTSAGSWIGQNNPDMFGVNLSAGNNADNSTTPQVADVTAVFRNSSGAVINTSTAAYDQEPTEFQLPENATNATVRATTASNLNNGTVFDAVLTFSNSSTSQAVQYDTNGSATSFVGIDSGTIFGVVQTGTDDMSGATIEIKNLDTVNNETVKTVTTNSQGEYSADVGGNANYTATVTALSGDNINNYQIRPTDNVFIDAGTSARVDIQLVQIQRPDQLNVVDVSPSSSVTADNSTIDITVELLDQNGDVLGGEDITASVASADVNASSVYFDSAQTITTGSDGQATFTVQSDTVQDATIDFSVVGSSGVSTSQDVSFTPTYLDAGDGVIDGEVNNKETESTVEDAIVYAVYEDRTVGNEVQLNGNFSNLTNSTVSYRLIDNSTGDVIDSDEYDVTLDTTDQSNFTLESDVRTFNASDAATGTGFNVTQDATTSEMTFNVTVLTIDEGDYKVQIANGSSPADGDFTNMTSFTATQNLTLADAENREDITGQNLVDMTDEEGYYLNSLNTNGNEDRDYLVIAQKTGQSTEFVSPITATKNNNAVLQNAIELEDRAAPPVDAVNITNVGLRTSLDGETYVPDNWANTSDEYAQVVPRDGTYDVINVSTYVEDTGDAGNGTVTLEVPDEAVSDASGVTSYFVNASFQGAFSENVESGTVVAIDTQNDTITIATGEDGHAQVFLQTDEAGVDLTQSDLAGDFTGVTANLQGATSDAADDRTNKTFVGVTEFETGSLSGLVTAPDNTPIPGATVFISEFTADSGVTFEVEQASGDNFTITRTDTGTSVEVTLQTLIDGYDFQEFSQVTSTEPVSLATSSLTDEARYTMNNVPAPADATVTGVSPTGVTGSAPASLIVNQTATSNIVISGVTEADISVQDFTVPTENITAGERFTVEATVVNNGDVAGSSTIALSVEGTPGPTEDTGTVGAGETATVTFDISFSDAGDYNISVGGLDSKSVTVVEADNGTSLTDVLNTIEAYENGNASLTDVLNIISEYES